VGGQGAPLPTPKWRLGPSPGRGTVLLWRLPPVGSRRRLHSAAEQPRRCVTTHPISARVTSQRAMPALRHACSIRSMMWRSARSLRLGPAPAPTFYGVRQTHHRLSSGP